MISNIMFRFVKKNARVRGYQMQDIQKLSVLYIFSFSGEHCIEEPVEV